MRKLALTVIALMMAVLLGGCSLLSELYALTARKEAGLPAATSEPMKAVEAPGMVYETEAYGLADGGAVWVEFNTEEYAAFAENGFRQVALSPLSTFSADVDTASYCNLRRMIADGYYPGEIPSGAVRVEEMLNYFRYDYPAPEAGEPFAVRAQIADCPWNPEARLLMLGVRAADAPAEAVSGGSNLVFLVDVSGSMSHENKLDLVKQALKLLLDQLGENDVISIVTYASGEQILIEGASAAADRERLLEAIDSLYASGSTNGERGLAQAYEVARRCFREGGNNRVIMCSDGDLNVGITSESELSDFVAGQRDSGIYLTVLGFGAGNYKDTKMETLADDGNGSYYYIDSLLEARKVLCEELTATLFTVARDVKLQIEFNPARVSAWRQVGYENRSLNAEDFEDDKKDAGEVGAGATVTVLYELIPATAADGAAIGESGLRYQTSVLSDAAMGSEWLTLSLRYKAPGEEESRLMEFPVGDEACTRTAEGDLRFAAAVAEFGMILRDSEFVGTADYDSVLALLKEDLLTDEYRDEFFALVKTMERRAAETALQASPGPVR